MQEGAQLLASAIKDDSRTDKPASYGGLLLSVSATDPAALASKLESINNYCPIPEFIACGQYAKSDSTLEQTKLDTYDGQSIEWQINTLQNLLPLREQLIAEDLATVNNSGQQLITTIDDALTQAAELKTARDQRLNQAQFAAKSSGVDVQLITAGTAKQLADSVATKGSDQTYWAMCVFVGQAAELNKIKEVL
ncbi:hypothetical protein CWB68_19820 [Pseudoalteromonas sp. S979]|nr:hypothetical protein CWB86_14485 [Pseudoalteromonas sp. S1731]TMS72900.1 hypothetical protein CWB88_13810 [Pseudoalteromonas sp. S1941]TMS75773.1 hypothetical protein CWB82_19850 [Pseudoalteromonas sp. S1690]TMS83683.1 hypothetical protein CWB70_18995 [Pseudoalteromonas sp. S981]TMS87710.1 hypothetical protein CWB69_18740 [Pseudoalteromonas sp. S980]TMS94593.1 hypothetical protein CWB68_19820 [Pseudoalteromonas sp. S979]